MRDRRTDFARRARFDEMRDTKLQRLRTVCCDWSRHELEALAARMTRIELKYGSWRGLQDWGNPLEG